MQRYGRTGAGTQRWFCKTCRESGVRTRHDVRLRHARTHFVRWLTGVLSLSAIATSLGLSRKQLTLHLEPLWHTPAPLPPRYTAPDHTLIMDGVYLSGRVNAVLILRTHDTVRTWSFAERECFVSWDTCLSRVPPPHVAVIDGQKGLTEAVKRRFPHARIQRCLVHVERFVRMCLSRHPKTDAGHALWSLMRSIWKVETPTDREKWTDSFHAWEEHYAHFLKERSVSPLTGRWWYTHRKVRAARSHIRNALPHLFTFIEIPGVPRTTNHVEGGTNARLKELVHRHRGLSPERKRVMAAYFLSSKTVQKPTRKVT